MARNADFLSDEESAHALRVLRLKSGDPIQITDGQGGYYHCTVTEARKGTCYFKVNDKTSVARPPFEIHIALAPAKNHDRIEWFVEKATEIGVNRISFFIAEHSERKKINSGRLQKVAVSAMKQSLKAWLPEINEPVPFATILKENADQRYIAHLGGEPTPNLMDTASRGGSTVVLIGPEGDFSPGELAAADAARFKEVTLGPHRLRTETAALAAAHTLSIVNR